jgi:hypothetical protein
MSVLSFANALDRKHGPNAEHLWRAPSGQVWQRYACDFEYEGCSYSFEIWATSREDAHRRLAFLRKNAVLAGQVYATGNA